jgi:LPS sulfotransferase NodH
LALRRTVSSVPRPLDVTEAATTSTGHLDVVALRQPKQTYIIAATPEAGSDFLARLLTKTDLAGQPKEYFKPSGGPWHKEWGFNRRSPVYRPYVDAALHNATSPNGVFGATMQWDQFAWLHATLRAENKHLEADKPAHLMDLVFLRPKYIWLRRRTTSRQAIEYYERIHSGKRPGSAPDGTEPPNPLTTDLVYVRWLEALLVDHDRQWRQFFEHGRIQPLELYYGSLLADWRRVVRTVLAYLGLERPQGGIRRAGRPPREDLGWSATWAPRYRDQRRLLVQAPEPAWVGVDRLQDPTPPREPTPKKGDNPSDERVLYSCVTDQVPILRYQTLVWCLTLIELAGRSPDQIVVHAVKGTSREHLKEVRDLGVNVVTVQPYDKRNPFANKLRQLDSPALREADRVVLCDCDLAFCKDVSAEIQGDAVGAKVVDAGYPLYRTWVPLARLAGVNGPIEPRRSTQALRWTYANNINGGFLVIPRDWLPPLAEAWPRWLTWILEHGGVFTRDTKVVRHAFQVAFGLAVLDIDPPIRQLSPALNFSTLPPHNDGCIVGVDPLVLHYHRRLDDDGLLVPTGRSRIDGTIATVNALLRRPEHRKTTAAALREWNKSR